MRDSLIAGALAGQALNLCLALLNAGMCSVQGTFYGQQDGQDAQGTCSYNENFANSVKLPWTTGVDATIALNDAQFASGSGCGLCIKYRGTGAGLGTTPLSTSEWKTGFVNNRCTFIHASFLGITLLKSQFMHHLVLAPVCACNTMIAVHRFRAHLHASDVEAVWMHSAIDVRALFGGSRCPECAFGDIDINKNGDGRWKVEWYAVPCNTGDSSLRYDIVVSSYYWFSLVVSNTRCALAAVPLPAPDTWSTSVEGCDTCALLSGVPRLESRRW